MWLVMGCLWMGVAVVMSSMGEWSFPYIAFAIAHLAVADIILAVREVSRK